MNTLSESQDELYAVSLLSFRNQSIVRQRVRPRNKQIVRCQKSQRVKLLEQEELIITR